MKKNELENYLGRVVLCIRIRKYKDFCFVCFRNRKVIVVGGWSRVSKLEGRKKGGLWWRLRGGGSNF